MRSKVAKVPVKDSTLCVVCEFALSKIEEELKDGATEVRKFVYQFLNYCGCCKNWLAMFPSSLAGNPQNPLSLIQLLYILESNPHPNLICT
jgi:hypothetical protein